MINAVGTSLLAFAAFGLATATSCALSGLVDWPLAGVFIVRGIVDGMVGTVVAKRLSGRGSLTTVFAVLISFVAA